MIVILFVYNKKDMNTEKVILKPVVGYVGGKRRFADKIISKFPKESEYKCYYEPFIGMGAVFLKLRPKKAVISDLDPDVINVWKQIRDNPERVLNEFKKVKYINKSVYAELTKFLNNRPKLNYKRAAIYVMYLSKSFGALPKKTKDGIYIVSFAKGKELNLNTLSTSKTRIDNIRSISGYLKSNDVKILNVSFDKIKYNRLSVIYMDPPYHKSIINYNRTPLHCNVEKVFTKESEKSKVFMTNVLSFSKVGLMSKFKKMKYKNKNGFKGNKENDEVMFYN
jgi:DNA adenine methylase